MNPLLSQKNALLLLSLTLTAAHTHANPLQSIIVSFEEPQRPEWVDHGAISQKRAILGQQSLLWQWQAQEVLTFSRPIPRYTDQQARQAFGKKATQVMSFWIYNEVPIDQHLKIRLSHAGQAPSEKSVHLGFSGWRSVGLSLDNDFSPAVSAKLDTIAFIAPTSGTGSLYLDRLMFSIDDARHQWSDHHYTTRYADKFPEIDFGLTEPLPEPSQEALLDAEQIKRAMIARIAKKTRPLAQLRAHFDTFQIREAHGVIRGRHLLTDKQQVIYNPTHLHPDDLKDFKQYAILGRKDKFNQISATGYTDLMLEIGQRFTLSQDTAERTELANMYVLMTKHLLDQGFAEGSSMVTTHHWGYSSRGWYTSALLMESVLSQHHQLDAVYRSLLWHSREFKQSFDMVLTPESSNLDYFNTLSLPHLALILINPNPRERIALLDKFSHFFTGALTQTPPSSFDGLRDDGTAFRHHGHYPGYAFPAFDHAAEVIYLLRSSVFAIEQPGLDKLKKAMIAGWHYTNPMVPLALSGRHPFGQLGIERYAEGIKKLALSYPTLDKELAGIYLQVTGQNAQQSQAHFGQVIPPAPLPQGSWSYNGGAFAVHRFGHQMAIMKGYNDVVWSSEIYTKDNRFGRYQSNGSLHVLPYGEPTQFGFQQSGWDWARNPGATGIKVALDKLESFTRDSLMMYSKQGKSGATTLDAQHTLFSHHHVERDYRQFDASFRANKHVLASGNRLYLTGNNIRNTNSNQTEPTETTLFQLATTARHQGVNINATWHRDPNLNVTLGSGDWLMDANHVGYLLIDVDPVKVVHSVQTSRHNKTKQPTQGEFITAWINHGVNPSHARYEYVMVMETNVAEMQQLAQQYQSAPSQHQIKPSEILETSAKHHLVRMGNLYGFTAFAAAEFERGVVAQVSQPAQILVQQNESKQLKLSVSALDLNLYKTWAYGATTAPNKPVHLVLTLRGRWAISPDIPHQYHGSNTEISLTHWFANAQQLTLTPLDH